MNWRVLMGASVIAAIVTVLGGMAQHVFIVGPQQRELQERIQTQQMMLRDLDAPKLGYQTMTSVWFNVAHSVVAFGDSTGSAQYELLPNTMVHEGTISLKNSGRVAAEKVEVFIRTGKLVPSSVIVEPPYHDITPEIVPTGVQSNEFAVVMKIPLLVPEAEVRIRIRGERDIPDIQPTSFTGNRIVTDMALDLLEVSALCGNCSAGQAELVSSNHRVSTAALYSPRQR